MTKPRKIWVYSPARDPRTKPSDAVKEKVERQARALIETSLTPNFVKPPPKAPKVNYVTGFSTKWAGRFFYIVADYACPYPNAVSPTFKANFARLEHTALGRFNLAYMRYTGEWLELFTGLTLERCLEAVRDEPWFQR